MPNFKKNPSPAMKKSVYKMKGSPMQRNFGIGSPMQKTSKARKEFEAMKAGEGSASDKLATTYGGIWSKKVGDTSFTNEKGQTAVQVAVQKSKEEGA